MEQNIIKSNDFTENIKIALPTICLISIYIEKKKEPLHAGNIRTGGEKVNLNILRNIIL
jgi:hypothetical protein